MFLDENNVEAKLLNKQRFGSFWMYYNVGAEGWNWFWIVSLEFPMGAGNISYSDPDRS